MVSLFATVIVACSTSVSTPAPSGQPSPAISAPVPEPSAITSADAAAAAVIATDERFAGIKARNPNLIGGCCFWTATPTADGYDVTIEIGWGDCPAGCIDKHRWHYAVDRSAAVRLVSEEGPTLPPGVPGSGGGAGG